MAATIQHLALRIRNTFPLVADAPPPQTVSEIAFCESVRGWAEQYPDASTQDLLPPQDLNRILPLSIENEIHPSFLAAQHKDVPAKYLARVPNATLIGKDGMILLPNGCYALEWAFQPTQFAKHPNYQRSFDAPIEQKSGTYYSFLWKNWRNYYHWLHDSVMRLYRAVDEFPSDIQFIIPDTLSHKWRETLTTFGIPQERMIEFDGAKNWRLKTLYFTSYTKRPSYDLPEELNWFRTRMWNACGVIAKPRQKRIYISRRNAKYRHVLNETQILEVLAEYDFESYILEDLSFGAQVKLFAEAQLVVAPHGAGLTNLLFAPPHSALIELFSSDFVSNVYWSICAALQINYWYLLGRAPIANLNAPTADIEVPINQCRQLLAAALHHIRSQPA